MTHKLCVIDIDGVLTDGRYHVSSDGVITKSFHTYDFWAIERFQTVLGIEVFLLTQSTDACISHKLDSLKMPINCASGVENKKEYIEDAILPAKGISWNDILYIGDSENDLECMKLSGLSVCPNGAMSIVIEECNFSTIKGGGEGVVFEVFEWIRESQNASKSPNR